MSDSIYQVITVAGMSIQGTITREVEAGVKLEVTLPAGKSGSLTTRTDDNTGTATLTTGHGITDGTVVDVYWATGHRRGMTVGTVATNAVPIDGGAGDNLPAQDTALVVTARILYNLAFDGDDAKVIAAGCDQKCALSFRDSGPTELLGKLLTANEPFSWASDTGVTSPLAGNAVVTVSASNGSTTAATLKIGAGYDATP